GSEADRFVVGSGSDTVTDLLVGVDFLELTPGVSVQKIVFANTDGAGALDAIVALSTGSVTVLNTGNLVTEAVLFGV
ncbi:MAG: hypothetical protein ACXWUN_13585, partial [Allosphingosinicella sp.]